MSTQPQVITTAIAADVTTLHIVGNTCRTYSILTNVGAHFLNNTNFRLSVTDTLNGSIGTMKIILRGDTNTNTQTNVIEVPVAEADKYRFISMDNSKYALIINDSLLSTAKTVGGRKKLGMKVKYNNRVYTVRTENRCKYIVVNDKKTWFSDIKGKYTKVDA